MSLFEWIVVGALGTLIVIGVLCLGHLEQIRDRLPEPPLDDDFEDETEDERRAAEAAAERVARFRAEHARKSTHE